MSSSHSPRPTPSMPAVPYLRPTRTTQTFAASRAAHAHRLSLPLCSPIGLLTFPPARYHPLPHPRGPIPSTPSLFFPRPQYFVLAQAFARSGTFPAFRGVLSPTLRSFLPAADLPLPLVPFRPLRCATRLVPIALYQASPILHPLISCPCLFLAIIFPIASPISPTSPISFSVGEQLAIDRYIAFRLILAQQSANVTVCTRAFHPLGPRRPNCGPHHFGACPA
ncbi:hypothetical protein GY45DRAFT_877655 [Cubamyces sp. BRFM 1775]|nr:hypothetical protein GY45DRAFT_877655 [Cubamyces sp. BRFM 1775]